MNYTLFNKRIAKNSIRNDNQRMLLHENYLSYPIL